jgi:hypothetical protein
MSDDSWDLTIEQLNELKNDLIKTLEYVNVVIKIRETKDKPFRQRCPSCSDDVDYYEKNFKDHDDTFTVDGDDSNDSNDDELCSAVKRILKD